MAKRAAKAAVVELTGDMRFVVLHGPEDMLQRERLRELTAVLEAAHGEVSRFDIDGSRASLSDVMDEVRGYSLMGGYKLVVVDQAMAGDADAKGFVSEHRGALERYAAAPVDHATLVLRGETWRPGKLDKAVAKIGAVIKCAELKPAEAQKWLEQRAEPVHGVKLPSKAAKVLVSRVGTGLQQLDTELAKLAAVAGGEGQAAVTVEMVESQVELSSDEKAWVVQNALLEAVRERSSRKALEKVRELVDVSGQPEVLLLYFAVDLSRKLVVNAQMRRAGANDA